MSLLIVALAMLSLRALTPDGYMPGSSGSGLLFELCPDGMPHEIMRALSGNGAHHHHGDDDGSASVASGEQCPIGHMLASAVAADAHVGSDVVPSPEPPANFFHAVVHCRGSVAYRSRAPPA